METQFSGRQEIDPIFLGRLALFAGLIFYSLFGIVDYLDYPNGYRELWAIRFGFGSPAILLALAGAFITRDQRVHDALLFAAVQAVGLSLIVMIWWGPGQDIGPHLSGLLVLLVYNFFAFRLRFLIATASGLFILLQFFLGNLIQSYDDPVFVLNGAIFLAVTFLPLQFGAVLTELFMRRNFVQSARLDELARTDSLTELPNRRAFMEALEAAIGRFERYGHRFALLLLDLDQFKRINDEFGHAAGDVVLCRMGERVRATLRTSDLLARLGGEEFALLLPETGQAGAQESAERIRRCLAETDIEIGPGVTVALTASIGVVVAEGESVGPDRLLRRADDAMYAAKHAGRNRVVVSGS